MYKINYYFIYMKDTKCINININMNLVFKILTVFIYLAIAWIIYTYFFRFKEGFDPNALLTYDSNSPKNSHNVDVVNNKYSCSNFCGPQSQCALTREQCTSDIDCQGCQPKIDAPPKYLTNTEVKPMNAAGKLTWTQAPQYSPLTSDIGTKAAYAKPGSKQAEIDRPYEGYDMWTKSFNFGLELADRKLVNQYSPEPDEYKSIPVYPVTRSATGLFYDTGPTASNADI
jgi:hypothetical protein